MINQLQLLQMPPGPRRRSSVALPVRTLGNGGSRDVTHHAKHLYVLRP